MSVRNLIHVPLTSAAEDLLARLTAAAYDVALRRPQGSFLDLQLGLWAALREVLEVEVLHNASDLEVADFEAQVA